MDTQTRQAYEEEFLKMFDLKMQVTGKICDSCNAPISPEDIVYVYADRSKRFQDNWNISRTHCSECNIELDLEPVSGHERVSAKIKCKTYSFGNPDFLGLTRLDTTVKSA